MGGRYEIGALVGQVLVGSLPLRNLRYDGGAGGAGGVAKGALLGPLACGLQPLVADLYIYLPISNQLPLSFNIFRRPRPQSQPQFLTVIQSSLWHYAHLLYPFHCWRD